MITHKWRAARWSDEYYIGYAYVDDNGVQHNGSARIRAASAAFYHVGQPIEVLVDLEIPQRSLLVDRSHLSLMETLSENGAMTVLTGLFCAFGWWLLLSRMWRRWRGLRRPSGARQAPAG